MTENDSVISNVQIKQKIHDRFAFVTISSQLLIILFSLSTRTMKNNTSKKLRKTSNNRDSKNNTFYSAWDQPNHCPSIGTKLARHLFYYRPPK